ncbi:MAG TPA: recombinase family protein [Candidatus Saccharimonadales bacterium]|nr:recombinase family protein [Candidatus Saccharimonadales bacterium]
MQLFNEDKLKGVAYYRFSAEDKQENSIENQREALEKKVAAEDIELVEAFKDEGISGLTFNRPGFQAMLEKYVYADDAPKIDYILFYDASRFGRVQKISHAWRLIADMEDRNIRLGSVDRGIPRSDMTVSDTIIMTLDFVMSKEYVRLLSNKVSAGCRKIASQGYSAGGVAPYGYVRILLDEQRNRVRILEHGVHKEVSNQRVAFEPATTGEAEIVKRIFREFVDLGYFPTDIAETLNDDGIPTAKNKQWNSSSVVRILTNETYTGTRVYDKTWAKLKEQKRANPPEEWVRCLNAHEALVNTDTFHKAQERLYWLSPRSRNQSSRRIYTVQSYVNKYLEEVISDYNDDQKHYIRRYTPISFGANYSVDGMDRVCFYLPPDKTKYDEFLLCAVDINNATSGLQAVYKLKSEDLNKHSFVIIGDEAPYSPLEQNELKDAILNLVNKVVSYHAPWLKITAPSGI